MAALLQEVLVAADIEDGGGKDLFDTKLVDISSLSTVAT